MHNTLSPVRLIQIEWRITLCALLNLSWIEGDASHSVNRVWCITQSNSNLDLTERFFRVWCIAQSNCKLDSTEWVLSHTKASATQQHCFPHVDVSCHIRRRQQHENNFFQTWMSLVAQECVRNTTTTSFPCERVLSRKNASATKNYELIWREFLESAQGLWWSGGCSDIIVQQ